MSVVLFLVGFVGTVLLAIGSASAAIRGSWPATWYLLAWAVICFLLMLFGWASED